MQVICPPPPPLRNLILLFSRYKTLCKTQKNICEFHLYSWDHVCKVNKRFSVYCFHHEFKVSTQMVHDYCIAEWKKFSACGRHLVALMGIFFANQNNHAISNPDPLHSVAPTFLNHFSIPRSGSTKW